MNLSDLESAAQKAAAARHECALLNEELAILAENSEPAFRIISDLYDKAALLLQTIERITRSQQ